MKKVLRINILRLLAVLFSAGILFACANVGNPNGGPYDEKPPRMVSSKPAINQLNYKGNRIEITFDEYIKIDNPSENVIITPPQKQSPVIQAIGKKIRVELRDTLLEETTYTVDFTSSIRDNNEDNALENFSMAFSTGDVLDTLIISGILFNAEDLEPVQNTLVGIHRDLSDTAFTKTSLLRTSKTDERGRFIIRNVSPGSYRVFALEDKNRNYAYDKNNGEALAFLDSIVIPTCERTIVPDTVWRDSLCVDTIRQVERTLFYPNDLVLWFFRDSITPRQRMLRPERSTAHIFTLKFNAPIEPFPTPVPLNFEPVDSTWYVTQKGEDAESFAINYWILDSMIFKKDTLQLEISYWKSNDSIPELLEFQTDTVNIAYREPVQPRRRDAAPRRTPQIRRTESAETDSVQVEAETPPPPPPIPLQMNISPSGLINPYDIITVIFNEPVMDVRKEFFVLEIGVDSLWEAVDFDFEADSVRAMTYLIKRPFKYNESYRVSVDSAMITSVYGRSNNQTSVQMTVKGAKEYGNLNLTVHGLPLDADSGAVMPAFVELINSNGAFVRKSIIENGIAQFKDLAEDKYFVRLILDANGNGRWDAGNYEEKRQPEQIYYFMKQLDVPLNWTIDDDWYLNTSQSGEKPLVLLKNKPKEQTKVKRDYREESNPQRSNSSRPPGLGGVRF